VQTNLVAIREYLRQRQIPCAVINITGTRRESADGVYYPRSALEVARLLLRLDYDIVHLHLGGNLTLRLLGLSLFCSWLPRRKSVLTFHSGGYPSSKEGQTAGPLTLRGFVFRRLDRVIGVNPEIVELFRKFGLRPDRVRLIYPHAPAAPPPGTDLPEPLRGFTASHRPLLLTVGLLEPEYDLPIQIEVLGRIRERFPGAGLVIIGSGSLEEELRHRIEAVPYREHILLCGDVPHAATLRAIAECDLFLRTTLYDGDSISVREALHLGTTVIATDNGMRPAGVHLIPPSDLAALGQAIEAQLARCGSRQRQSESSEENIKAVYDLYQELMNEK
jgi:glycosyltransferase involved in cell wall biosynthesis